MTIYKSDFPDGFSSNSTPSVVSLVENTASNLGTGTDGEVVFDSKVALDLRFKRIKAGAHISVTAEANDILITNTMPASEVTTASNLGSGANGEALFSSISGVDLQFKRIKAGTGVTLTSEANDIKIDTSGEVNTASNLGTGSDGSAIFNAKSGVDLQFKRIKAGTGIIITSEANDLKIDASGGSSPIIEIFNTTVVMSTNSATLTGIAYFKAPQAMTVLSVIMQIYDKGTIVTGSLTLDLKKNTTPDMVGMTSIFTVLPTTDFSINANYASSTGTLNGTISLASGDWLRLDLISIPTGLGKFYIQVFGV
jgi:hypothetical protein